MRASWMSFHVLIFVKFRDTTNRTGDGGKSWFSKVFLDVLVKIVGVMIVENAPLVDHHVADLLTDMCISSLSTKPLVRFPFSDLP